MSRTKKGAKGVGWEPWSNLRERQEQKADYLDKEETPMKLFALDTTSESGDDYSYIIAHPQMPTSAEIKAFLIVWGSDVDEDTIYEHVRSLYEVSNKDAKEIPELTKEKLDSFQTCGMDE